jgi:hypothetical protein
MSTLLTRPVRDHAADRTALATTLATQATRAAQAAEFDGDTYAARAHTDEAALWNLWGASHPVD